MSEIWLTIGSTTNAARAVLRDIYPRPGIGMARLMFTFEVSTKQQAVAGLPVWLGGHVDVLHLPQHTQKHLASFQPQTQLLTLPQLGAEHTMQLTLDISDHQLQLIEERRSGGVRLNISLTGHTMRDGQAMQVPDAQFTHDISQGDWISLLEQVGYRRFLLLELEALNPQAHPDLAEATDYYVQAGTASLKVSGVSRSRACASALRP